jgi:outer membrane protein
MTLFSAAVAAPAVAHEAGEWVFRGGVGMVAPKSNNLDINGLSIPPVTIDASVDVDDGTSLVLSATYMFTRNWAFDILAAAPFKHDIDLSATIDDGTTVASATVPLGEVKHLPPTFSVQYHFTPDSNFQPYAGLGVNWTLFSSEKVSGDAQAVGVQSLKLDDSVGLAAQVGADWMINDNWLVNFDVRYINIESDAKLTIDDGTGPETGDIGTVDINPWVFSLNIGYKFD